MIEMDGDTKSPVPDWVREHKPGGTLTPEQSKQENERLIVGWEILQLVDDRLLEWGVDPITGDAIFWATAKGKIELGMN